MKEYKDNSWKIAVTFSSAFVCGMAAYGTHGETGLGWFILIMFLLWCL